jgi:mRNA-degrading endonuclease RelE of RelBE toxin-antitoxin system
MYKLQVTNVFKKSVKRLPKDIQNKLKNKLNFLAGDPNYPSLRTKKNNSWSNKYKYTIYESSIDMSYRFLWTYSEDEKNIIILYMAGDHDIVDV